MTEEGTRTTRRSVLRSGLLAISGVAGIFGLAGIYERVKSEPALAPGVASLKVYGTEWRLAAPGLRRGDVPKRGDIVSVTGVLRNAAGEAEGSFVGSVLHLDGTSEHGSYSSTMQETHTFLLPGGNLMGMGVNNLDGESVFAIVGGTGRFLGATGSYVGTQSPLDTGGDGTAEFTFTINSGR